MIVHLRVSLLVCACVCVCVCARARARVCACVCGSGSARAVVCGTAERATESQRDSGHVHMCVCMCACARARAVTAGYAGVHRAASPKPTLCLTDVFNSRAWHTSVRCAAPYRVLLGALAVRGTDPNTLSCAIRCGAQILTASTHSRHRSGGAAAFKLTHTGITSSPAGTRSTTGGARSTCTTR